MLKIIQGVALCNMKNKNKINKSNFMAFALLLLVFLGACTSQEKTNFSQTQAEKVVKTYFEAWDSQNWKTMYSLMSDGFKKIDPNAKTFADFEAFVSSQGTTAVKINSIKEKFGDKNQATVDYDVTFIINGKTTSFQSTFTVKYKPKDQQPGWKLIHPYGDNIDTS